MKTHGVAARVAPDWIRDTSQATPLRRSPAPVAPSPARSPPRLRRRAVQAERTARPANLLALQSGQGVEVLCEPRRPGRCDATQAAPTARRPRVPSPRAVLSLPRRRRRQGRGTRRTRAATPRRRAAQVALQSDCRLDEHGVAVRARRRARGGEEAGDALVGGGGCVTPRQTAHAGGRRAAVRAARRTCGERPAACMGRASRVYAQAKLATVAGRSLSRVSCRVVRTRRVEVALDGWR